MAVPGLALVLALTCVVPPVHAQGRGRGRGHEKADEGRAEETVVIDRNGHVRAIREYARTESLPPGLAKREALPPGLSKQPRENGELPPGLEKRLVPVPAPLAARLPRVPSYYDRYFAGEDLLIIDTRSHRIVAIIPHVWR